MAFCPECGKPVKSKFCPHCGAAVVDAEGTQLVTGENTSVSQPAAQPEQPVQSPQVTAQQPTIIINNVSNSNSSASASATAVNSVPVVVARKVCNKWTAFLLCLFLGYFGAHKFYEGKPGMGILYIFTMGLFGFGWLVDMIMLITKPNPYYV
jgi:restriction system protein